MAGKQVGGKLVVAGGDASDFPKPARGRLQKVSLAIAGPVLETGSFAGRSAGSHRCGARLS